jgi:pentose-5-phosphate-3-epimerase
MDGGLTPDTLQDAARAGVEAFVAATSIFRHSQGVAAGVKSLRSAISI